MSADWQPDVVLTPERTAFVKWLRVTKSHPWVAVGEVCAQTWGLEVPEGYDYELLGIALCHAAAASEGYHYMERAGGWN